jgi:hypothetical protein
VRGGVEEVASAWVSPWGDDQDEPRPTHTDDKGAPVQVTLWDSPAQATPAVKPALATPGDKGEDETSASSDGDDPQIQVAS